MTSPPKLPASTSPPIQTVTASPRFVRSVLIASTGLSLLTILIVTLPFIPLGVRGEWVWERFAFTAETPFSIVLGALFLGIYTACAFTAEARFSRLISNRSTQALLLSSVVVVTFLILMLLRSILPQIDGLARGPWILYYPRMSGYFTQARTSDLSTREFLAGYSDVMKEGDFLHQGTHPPGLILFHRALLWVCQPTVVQQVLRLTEPSSVSESLDILTQQSAPVPELQTVLPVVTPRDRAALWLGDLLTTLAVALTPIPLWFLLRDSGQSVPLVLRTLAFWPLMANTIVFLPKSDCLYTLLAISIIWTWSRATGSVSRTIAWGAIAGILSVVSLVLTLAFAPVLAMLLIITSFRLWSTRAWTHEVFAIVSAGIAFLSIPLLMWAYSGANLFEIWILNYHNHGRFYDHNTRTYPLWLLVNLLEWGMSSAGVVAVLAVIGVWASLKPSVRKLALKQPLVQASLAYSSVMLLLLFSGKNMGEAARLWIIFDPLLLMTSALGQASLASLGLEKSRLTWRMLFILQVLTTLAIIIRVNGFHLGDLS